MRHRRTALLPLGFWLLAGQVGARPSPGSALPIPADTGAVVYVDGYGVSHIFGPTDRSVVFASAWVEAEADWPLVDENFTRSVGRAAEFLGPEALGDDYLARSLEIPRLSREEYEAASPRMRGLLEAYADGFNAWLAAHPDEGRWLDHVEPWYPLALLRFKYHELEFLGYAGFRRSMLQALVERGWPVGAASPAVTRSGDGHSSEPEAATAYSAGSILRYPEAPRGPTGERPLGSNEWALAPSRTASGHAMLLVNPHQSFFGVQRYFELHLHSDEGLVFSGLTRFGFVLPYMGNNEHLGWAFTDNYADIGDLYVEHFDDAASPLTYRYGGDRRQATTWTEQVQVSTEGGAEERTLRFWKTHHGPVVGLDAAGRPLVARLAKLEEGGWADQLDAMIGASSLAEFRSAVSRLAIPYMNLMYADADGNIWYLYNSAVPRRDPSLDWADPVDGSDPGTEWQGYHTLDELPQVLNPESGFLLNTNSAPMVATAPAPFARSDFPPYMIGGETDNPRARSSLRALRGMRGVTLDHFARAVWDTHLSMADTLVPVLESQWRELQAVVGEADRPDLEVAMPRLLAWDREARIESVETTWFELALQARAERAPPEAVGGWPELTALARTLRALRERWGTIEVPWGQVNRLQRPPDDDPASFSDALPSLAVGGANGAVFAFYTTNAGGAPSGLADRRYGVAGNSMLKVVEFGPEPSARSVSVFGQSADSASSHFFDQAPLYAQRMFKPAWFTRAEVEAHAVKSYRPGGAGG